MIANNRDKFNLFNKSVLPWFICGMGMMFYCFNYFLRVSPSVMQSDLTQAFHISATQFGALAGFYYFAYTPMQLPVGMIYDKFGARFVLFFACLTAVLGLAIFISADSFAIAGAGRFLIGLGTAFSYIGVLKLASLWLPPNRFATVAGLTTAVGMTFGALSQRYLVHVVEAIGYQRALQSALIVGLVLSFTILLVLRSRPKQRIGQDTDMQTPLTIKQLGKAVFSMATSPQMWLIGIVGCLMYLPATVFLELWGLPYLKSVHQLASDQAVNILSITFFGWIISGPIIGMISDRIKRRRLPLVISGAAAAILLSIIFYVPGLSLAQLYVLFFLTGFSCGAHPLCFALGKENNTAQSSGTAVAVTNMLIMSGGFIFQPLVGKLLDWHSVNAETVNGMVVFSPSDYTYALSVVPLGLIIAIGLSFFLKETYCESHESVMARRNTSESEMEPPMASNVIKLKPRVEAVG